MHKHITLLFVTHCDGAFSRWWLILEEKRPGVFSTRHDLHMFKEDLVNTATHRNTEMTKERHQPRANRNMWRQIPQCLQKHTQQINTDVWFWWRDGHLTKGIRLQYEVLCECFMTDSSQGVILNICVIWSDLVLNLDLVLVFVWSWSRLGPGLGLCLVLV